MTARKKWRLVYPGSPDDLAFTAEKLTYEFVDRLRSAWVAGSSVGSLTVQVDEGMGWETYEHIDFATEGDRV